jgi:type II secretion system protein N
MNSVEIVEGPSATRVGRVLKERLKSLAPKIGFPIFYVLSLGVFASLTFPYDKLKERIVVTFNAQQRALGAQQELQIDELTSHFITGVKAKGVRLTSLNAEPGKPPVELKIDEARAKIALLPLLIGHHDVSFHLDAFGGEIDGEYDELGVDRAVEVELKGVDMGKVEPLTAMLGLPMEGKLSGTIKVSMPEGKASKGSGAAAFEATDVALGDGKAKLKGALALPRIVVGSLSFTGEAKEGVLKVTKLTAGGKDVELQGDGKVQMREMALESSCDVNVKFKVNDGYRTKSDVTKSLFGAPGSNAPALFDLADPKVKQAKRPDGFYAFHIRGLLGRPDFEPQGGGGGAGAGPGLKGFQ